MASHVIAFSGFIMPSLKPNILVIDEETLGIDQVRQIQTFLIPRPLGGEKNQIFILRAEKLSLPAQNALLKTLEEPPADAEIFLVTDQPDLLLPTVLSRCQITKTQNPKHPNTDFKKTHDLLDKLLAAKVGERLTILEAADWTREEFLQFLAEAEGVLHQNPKKYSPKIFATFLQTRKYLKANCNLKLCLAYLASELHTTPSSPPMQEGISHAQK